MSTRTRHASPISAAYAAAIVAACPLRAAEKTP
jgi:hypothetical protein